MILFFFQAEDGIRDLTVTGVQTCALPICVANTRSFSRNGFSQVTVIFDESADLYFMRQQVTERLTQARPQLPEGAEPLMGPVSTGLGEVFHYSVEFRSEEHTSELQSQSNL